MQLILRQGRVVDPSQKLNKVVDIGIEEGMRTLMMDGIAKMFKMHTDLSEVRRVCM